MRVAVDSVAVLQDAVCEGPCVLPVGGGTKPALSTPPADDVVALDMTALSGIVEYDPKELTITARAGTSISELRAALAEHGQYLPFDPPLADERATLGGAVATGASGPSAFRHGGVRDFVIGVRFVDGRGVLVKGGGRVVKNAAGFDLPKLLVGSAGRLGVIVQLSLKVFPRPRSSVTAILDLPSLEAALAALGRLARGPLAIDALDLVPPGRLFVRLAGPPATLAARVGSVAGIAPSELLEGDDDVCLWRDAASLRWAPAGARIVRVGVTPRWVAALDALLAGASTRYSLGANVAWVAWPDERGVDELDEGLRNLQLSGMPLTGPPERMLLGRRYGGAFAARIRAALDPDDRFPEA